MEGLKMIDVIFIGTKNLFSISFWSLEIYRILCLVPLYSTTCAAFNSLDMLKVLEPASCVKNRVRLRQYTKMARPLPGPDVCGSFSATGCPI